MCSLYVTVPSTSGSSIAWRMFKVPGEHAVTPESGIISGVTIQPKNIADIDLRTRKEAIYNPTAQSYSTEVVQKRS